MSAEESSEAEDGEESEPAVELGDGATIEGAPLARVASRLTWPLERSEVDRKVGATIIRTPDGPRELSAVLEEVDTTYFERRQEFLTVVRDAIGIGPVPTE